MTACIRCVHHRVRYFQPPDHAAYYSDRCMRLAKNPDDPESVGWHVVAETMDQPNRCGPERKFFKEKPGV